MGTACSSCSSARRWRRSRWCSGSSSAPSRPSQPEVQERKEAGARCNATPAEAPLPPLGEPDSDSELLDQVLAECDADGPGQLQLPPRHPSRLAVHSSSSPAGGAAWEQGHGDRQILLTRATQALENSNFANSYPLKKTEKSKTSYNYSEEEMMAAIEQEYGH